MCWGLNPQPHRTAWPISSNGQFRARFVSEDINRPAGHLGQVRSQVKALVWVPGLDWWKECGRGGGSLTLYIRQVPCIVNAVHPVERFFTPPSADTSTTIVSSVGGVHALKGAWGALPCQVQALSSLSGTGLGGLPGQIH